MESLLTKDYHDYVIIGLGKLGRSLAINLAEEGKNVLAIDKNSEYVEMVQGKVTHAIVADATKKEVLQALGVQNFDCAIICIGEDLSSSMLVSLSCKELKVPYIIAKAQSNQHKELLEKIGVNFVVFPESYLSKKLTTALVDPFVNEIVKINDNYKIVEIICPKNWENKTILSVNVRKKYGILIILVKRNNNIIEPFPELQFEKSDMLVVAGKPKNIEAIENKIAEAVDFEDRFAEATEE